jgi:hypothetical protein
MANGNKSTGSDGYGVPPQNLVRGSEPDFGNQCRDPSSCGRESGGTTMGEPSGRMPASNELRSEPGFPLAGSPADLAGRGSGGNTLTPGRMLPGASNKQWPEQLGAGYRQPNSGTQGS